MNIQNALKNTGIDQLDAELLLAHTLQKDRVWLMAHNTDPLTENQQRDYDAYIERRKNHEPLAYITNTKEFYGRDFYVDARVLIPRPATETLIAECLSGLKDKSPIHPIRITEADTDVAIVSWMPKEVSDDHFFIIDVGTGSGCIGITLALEHPQANIICTDASHDALDVAMRNAQTYTIFDRIQFVETHLLNNVEPTQPFFVVSNLPYIPEDESLMPDVQNFEPHTALFAEKKGFALIEELVASCKNDPLCLGIFLECRLTHAKKLMNIL